MSFREFQKAPNKLTARDIGFLILAGVIVIFVGSALALANYYLAGISGDGGEFYLLRISGRSFLFDRIEPYSGNIPARVQAQVYGHSASPEEDAYILDIPFHLLMVFFPLALFSEDLIARASWMALSELALLGFIFIGFRLIDRKIPRFFGALIFIACFSSFYAYRSFLEGSPTILLGLAFVGILLSLHAGLDELAGALIVLSSFQWEMGGPFLFFIVLWVFWERRWHVFNGGGMWGFILLVVSFFWYPGWTLPFLRAVWNSLRAGFGYSAHEILGQLWPDFGSTLGWVLTAVLVITLGYEWAETRGAGYQRLIWTVCVTLAATPLLGVRAEMDQLVLLTLPVMLVVVISRERWRKLGNGIAFLLLLFLFGVPWLLYTQGAPQWIGLPADKLLFLFWPLFTFIGLYWVRWWIIRPPRTWLDQVGRMKR
jgi:hypothetical protein